MRTRVLALLALVVLATPVQSQIQNPDESTPTTLYFHIFDTFNNFVINTQPMDVDFFDVGGTSFPTLTGTAVNGAMGAQWDFNTIYGVSTAGPVEYDFIENGQPRYHFERGIAADVRIDDTVQPMSYIYIDVRDFLGLDEASNILPDVSVRVTMRTGDEPGNEAQLDEGLVIMEGQVTATLCADGDTAAVPAQALCAALYGDDVLVPDGDGIVEVAIPMETSMDRIPKQDAFNIRIDWWQEDPAGFVCGEDQCAEGYLRLAADTAHLPRLEMNIRNPVYIEFIHPQVAAGTLLIHTGVNSPWGTYDVDAQNMTVTVEGPAQPANLERVVSQNQHVHGLHDQAAEITYLWKFRDEKAPTGDYTIRLEVPNGAGTAVATGQAGFTVEKQKAYGISDSGEVVEGSDDGGGKKKSPGPGLLAVLGILLLRRWRA